MDNAHDAVAIDTVAACRQMELEDLLAAAWKARAGSRPAVFEAVYPQKTMAVSVTGRACALGCSHCNGRYLEHMVDIRDFSQEMVRRTPSSILLSGGCDECGAVPVASWLRKLSEQGLRINVHPGIASEEAAREIADLASVISFDFVMDDEAIREAFHGRWTRDDYIRTFRQLLSGKAAVVPHILVGLKRGVVDSEYEALKFLLDEGVSQIIFIVFIPTPGTAWENLEPPSPQDVARLLACARILSPSLSISLGCMRPKGKYRESLDVLAVRAGVDRIVLPHPAAVKEAASRGLDILRKDECCAFE